MKADTLNLAQVFNKPVSYLVPLFQRPYVWEQERHWQPLWEDIRWVAERLIAERASATDEERENGLAEARTPPHFLGALVVEQLLGGAGMVDRRRVVDGQQRLTTLQLFLDAAHDVAAQLGDDSAKLFGKLTDNDSDLVKDLSDTYKVWPTNIDRVPFRITMRKDEEAQLEYQRAQNEDDNVTQSAVWRAHEFFCESIREWLSEDRLVTVADRLDVLRTVLWSLIRMVVIDLEPNDNPQVIFETLNARGTPLLATDLIKNAVFQSAIEKHLDSDRLYRRYWAELDDTWWRQEVQQGRLNRPRLDVFFTHWLTMRRGSEFGVHELFGEFKRFTSEYQGSTEELLADVVRYSKVYQSFSAQPAGTLEATFFYRLDVMETTTATPLLLYVMGLPEDLLSTEQRHRVLLAVESWLVRRLLCRLTTKAYNLNFQQLLAHVLKEPTAADRVTVQFLAGMEGESGVWPSDDQLERAILTLPLYKILSRGRMRMVLEALEEQLRAEHGYAEAPTPMGLSIEHILPQSWEPGNWPLPDNEQPEVAAQHRDILKHTLGNLTLITGKMNSLQSNLPWETKRKQLKEFAVLYLNKMLMDDSLDWDEHAIETRGRQLAALAMSIWPGPQTLLGPDLPERPEPLHIPRRTKAPASPKPKKNAVGRQKKYQEFWKGFLSIFRSRFPDWGRRHEPTKWAAIGFPSGQTGIWYDAHLGSKGRLIVDMITTNPGVYEHLLRHREQIEERFGSPLIWNRKEGIKRATVGITREGSVDDTERWADYQAWFVDTLARLRDAISPELTASALKSSTDG